MESSEQNRTDLIKTILVENMKNDTYDGGTSKITSVAFFFIFFFFLITTYLGTKFLGI